MSYQVLARKYRPRDLDEVIGQEHITRILSEAVKQDRVGQAYLFAGPRGIGKTSCARILAKSLNCEKGITVKPCGECSSCASIAGGNSFDVLEVDGASNRGIDEVRTIRENVKFAPSYGRYKVYIVDEVHMLTPEAFNALLKTLEEPPEHVKFIFATTDPNKVPATIISRCQRFDFKRITARTAGKVIKDVAAKEKIRIEDEAMFAIAKAANGSLRDALSILDQLAALSEQKIKAGDVYSMLGLVQIDQLFILVDALGAKDCCAAIDAFDDILSLGKDVRQMSRDLVEHFRHLMLLKIAGPNEKKIVAMGRLVDYPKQVKQRLLEQTMLFTLDDILLAVEELISSQEVSRVTEMERIPLELAFARMTLSFQGTGKLPVSQEAQPAEEAYAPGGSLKNERGQLNHLNEKQKPPVKPDVPVEKAEIPSVDTPIQTAQEPDDLPDFVRPLGPDAPVVDPGSVDLKTIQQNWPKLTHALSRERMSLATYLQDARPLKLHGELLLIGFTAEHAFFKETMEHADHILLVEKIFAQQLGRPVRVKYTLSDALPSGAVEDDSPEVKKVLDTFGGEIVNRWHNE
ncbi:MAG: DNA polymerase III subunit gamma/tau [Candidatus Omnitrophota bacterium]